MRFEHLAELTAGLPVEQARLVHHPTAERWKLQRSGGGDPQQHQQRQAPPWLHWNFTLGACSAFGAVALKFSRTF